MKKIILISFLIISIFAINTFFTNAAISFDYNSYFKITNQNSGLVIESSGIENNSLIVQSSFAGKDTQLWRLASVGEDRFKIISKASGKVLDIYKSQTNDGAALQIWDYVEGNNQRFKFTESGSGYKIINVNSNKPICVKDDSKSQGATLVQNSSSNSQVFNVEKVEKIPSALDNLKLVWSDEFNGNQVDTSNWGYEIGYKRNNEEQYYTNRNENARVENGNLIIEGRRETYEGYKYTAASLHTNGKRTFQYGRFEMRAKIPTDSGCWPAFWTLGTSKPWPENGEIDIMEFYKGKILANIAYKNYGSSNQWDAIWDSVTKDISTYSSDWKNNYHVWAMDWDESEIKLSVDNTVLNTFSVSKAANGSYNPFKQSHYIMVNLAIGGNNGGDASKTTFPQQYLIDYVRVYQGTPDSTSLPTSTQTNLKIGDINSDGKITSTDAALIERHILGVNNLNSEQIKLADTNKDSKITSTDVAIIERYILGQITTL